MAAYQMLTNARNSFRLVGDVGIGYILFHYYILKIWIWIYSILYT